MIWCDIAAMLLLTLRMVLFGPTQPRILDGENDSSLFVGENGQEENLSVTDEEANLFNLAALPSLILGVLQLHIHVMPDLKGRR